MADLLDALFDPTMTTDDLEWVRESWPGHLIVKGVHCVADARRMAAVGVDGIVLSSHGGRQLDRAPVPLRLLPEVRAALAGTTELYVDTGVMSGADVVAALTLGADAVMVGRAYLYGLMAYGEAGVDPGTGDTSCRGNPHAATSGRHERRAAQRTSRDDDLARAGD